MSTNGKQRITSVLNLLSAEKSLEQVGWLVLGLELLFFGYFCFVSSRYLLHSDSVSGYLLAHEIVASHRFLPPSWHYVNGEIWFLNIQLTALPFVHWPLRAYHQFGAAALLGAALFSAAIVFFLRSARAPRNAFLWTFIALFSGGSAFLTMIFLLDHVYSIFLAVTLVELGLAFRYLRAEKSRPGLLAGMAGLALLSTLNGPRGILSLVMPIAAGAGIAAVSGKATRRLVEIAGVTCVGGLLGILIYSDVLRPHLQVDPGQEILRNLATVDRLVQSLGFLFSGALTTLGFGEFDGQPLVTKLGVLVLARAAALSLLFWLSWSPVRRLFSGSTPEQALSRGWAIGGLIITFIVSVTTYSIVAPGSIRYFMMPLAALFLSLAATDNEQVTKWLERFPKPIRALGLYALLATALATSWVCLVRPGKLHGAGSEPAVRQEHLWRYLADHKLESGYATYWNAMATQVRSPDTELEICPVVEQTANAPAFKWLVSDNCFIRVGRAPSAFLYWQQNELQSMNRAEMMACLGKPGEVTHFPESNDELWIYPNGLKIPLNEARCPTGYSPPPASASG